MTTKSDQITENQIVRLAAAISASNMRAIGEGYMKINPETVKNMKHDASDSEDFNRKTIRFWRNKNPKNQVQMLAALLFKAAEECGYPDPNKVQEILGVSNATQTKDQLLKLIEDHRRRMERRVKTTPQPYNIDYEVSMDELYTDPVLEKICNKAHGPVAEEVKDDKKLFDDDNRSILVKGNLGSGTTTWARKLVYDWTKRRFKRDSVFFFIDLKLVKPGSCTEGLILKQTPFLKGKIKSKEKLTDIIEDLGNQCVLILDGLHAAPHMKDEVLGIVLGSKFPDCNILVTSRPHNIKGIEKHFDVVVSVKGFSLLKAETHVSSIVRDKKIVHDVLNFNPSGKRTKYKVPILLTTLCSIATHEKLDLSNKTLESEVLYRMLYHLYNVYVNKKEGEHFEESSFVKNLMRAGELALEPVSSEKHRQIIEQVIKEGFDCGFLVVREDFKWIPDKNGKNVDISVTFLDPSIQVFLEAFYFILSLGKNQTIHVLDETLSEKLKNRLFVQVCRWLLDKDNRSFSFPERAKASRRFANYVSKRINSGALHCTELVSQCTGNDENEKALKMLVLLACAGAGVIIIGKWLSLSHRLWIW